MQSKRDYWGGTSALAYAAITTLFWGWFVYVIGMKEGFDFSMPFFIGSLFAFLLMGRRNGPEDRYDE